MSALITFLVGGLLLVSWERLKHVRSVLRVATLADEAFGLAEVALPAGWRAARNLNEQAGVQAIEPLRHRYLIVISEPRNDFVAITLDEHSGLTRAKLVSSKRLIAIRGPWRRQVGTFDAVQYEMDAISNNVLVTFLHTTVLGAQGVHQIVGWATCNRFARAAFETVLDGFRETPAPPQSAPDSTRGYIPTVDPGSAFRVH